jgi:hypothetical protein
MDDTNKPTLAELIDAGKIYNLPVAMLGEFTTIVELRGFAKGDKPIVDTFLKNVTVHMISANIPSEEVEKFTLMIKNAVGTSYHYEPFAAFLYFYSPLYLLDYFGGAPKAVKSGKAERRKARKVALHAAKAKATAKAGKEPAGKGAKASPVSSAKPVRAPFHALN